MNKSFKISLACMQDAVPIHKLMEKVYENMMNKDMFFCDDLEFVKNHIENQGFIVKAVYDGDSECTEQIAGVLIVRFPKNFEDNLGRDVGITELHKVAHMESVVVDVKFRGYGLQDRMLKYAEKIIMQREYTYLLATVSPENKHSLDNFKKNGYEAVMVKEKYGGMVREILLKQLNGI